MEQSFILIKPAGPFRLDLTVWVLRRRSNNIVDQWRDGVYRRIVVVQNRYIGLAVQQRGTTCKPILKVSLSGKNLDAKTKSAVRKTVEKMLGTDINLKPFYLFASHDKTLGPITAKYTGFRPTRFASVFETAVNGICCQQLSLDVGITLLNRLVAASGRRTVNLGEPMYAFPTPDQVARLEMEDFRKLGFSASKAEALMELAAGVAGGCIDIEGLEAFGDERAIRELTALRGLGRWTAEYVLLRGLGRLHIYPGDDSGFGNGLKRWLSYEGKMDRAVVQEVMSKWPRYGGMVYFHLLLERLCREKLIDVATLTCT